MLKSGTSAHTTRRRRRHFARARAIRDARGSRGQTAEAAAAAKAVEAAAASALAQAESEGLNLDRSADNPTGFRGVSRTDNWTHPFAAALFLDGRGENLGSFLTAEEAALEVARRPRASSPASRRRRRRRRCRAW